jgi:hypothetical protein
MLGLTIWRAKAVKGEIADRVELPGVMACLEFHDGPPSGPARARFALIQNHAAGTWAATAEVVHPGIGLTSPEQRDRWGRGLAELLNSVNRAGLVSEVIFMVRTVPDDGEERRQYLARHHADAAPAAARQISDQIAAMMARGTVRTESYVTVVVPEAALKREAKDLGQGTSGRGQAMLGVMDEVERLLVAGMGMDQVNWLTTSQLRVAIRTGVAPGDRAGIIAALHAAETDPQVQADIPWAVAGPGLAELGGRHYSHDAWWTTAATIHLPTQGAVMGALADVLQPEQPGERRCLMVSYPVVDRAEAEKKVRNAETTADMAEGLNEKLGRKTRASEQAAIQRTRSLDAKIHAGNALIRPYAAASVTVPRTRNIAEAGRRLEASIRGAGFAPLRMDLAHDQGLAVTAVPLGLSLRRK